MKLTKCPEIVLKFAKKLSPEIYFFLLGPLLYVYRSLNGEISLQRKLLLFPVCGYHIGWRQKPETEILQLGIRQFIITGNNHVFRGARANRRTVYA